MYAFELTRAKTVADAAAALAKSGGKALAGGQSLVGAMKLRLAQPGTLVDLAGIALLTAADVATSACRVIAPMTTASPSFLMPFISATPERSTSVPGCASRSFIAPMRL